MIKSQVNVVVIGFGYWGPNLVRNVLSNSKYNLLAVVETSSERRMAAEGLFEIRLLTSLEELDLKEVDLAVIATRPGSHLAVAERFLSLGIDCLIPKPVGDTIINNSLIGDLGNRYGARVFSEYTYLYSEALAKIKDWFEAGPTPKSYTSYRTSLGIIQSDVNVIEDLASHDLANLIFLKKLMPNTVQAIDVGSKDSNQVNSCFLGLSWDDGFEAAIHVSWLSPRKMRQISIMKETQALIFDETNRTSPLSIMEFDEIFKGDLGEDFELRNQRNVSFSMGKELSITLEGNESLKLEFDCISKILLKPGSNEFYSDFQISKKVWTIIAALNESVENGGRTIRVK